MVKKLLLLIIVLAFLLRFWNAGNQDIFGDEAAYAFRSVGYLDYLGTNFQTQPIDWYKNQPLPGWTKLSFHDHPPLFFIIQNAFFRVFGDSVLTARLPAIFFGVIAVFLIYLLVRKFYDYRLALIAAFLFSVNGAMVWIFRTSLIEPVLISLMLLNIYFFFKFLENQKRWPFFGVTLGLIFLTKYTSFFLVPVYVFYLILNSILRKSYPRRLRDWRLYAAFGLALLIFSPVIIYNLYLYKATGHFDLQFSYLLGQEAPEWTGLAGKIQAPFSEIGKNMADLYGVPVMAMAFLGLVWAIVEFYRSFKLNKFNSFSSRLKFFIFLLLYLLFATLLFVKIGSANRFLALYGLPIIVFAAYAVWQFLAFLGKGRWNYLFKLSALAFVGFEMFYSFDKNFIKAPDYGVAKLDRYFEEEFRGKESAVIPESDNQHLNSVILKFAAKKKTAAPRDFSLIIYNDNIALPTLEWIFYRRFFYHSAPVLFVENFNKTLQTQGQDYFKGFSIYFAQSAENTLLNPFKVEKTAGLELENNLRNKGLKPIKMIYGQNNLPMFRIYQFTL